MCVWLEILRERKKKFGKTKEKKWQASKQASKKKINTGFLTGLLWVQFSGWTSGFLGGGSKECTLIYIYWLGGARDNLRVCFFNYSDGHLISYILLYIIYIYKYKEKKNLVCIRKLLLKTKIHKTRQIYIYIYTYTSAAEVVGARHGEGRGILTVRRGQRNSQPCAKRVIYMVLAPNQRHTGRWEEKKNLAKFGGVGWGKPSQHCPSFC